MKIDVKFQLTLKFTQRTSGEARLYQLRKKYTKLLYPTGMADTKLFWDRSDASGKLGTKVVFHYFNHSYMTFQCRMSPGGWVDKNFNQSNCQKAMSISSLPTYLSNQWVSMYVQWLNHRNSIKPLIHSKARWDLSATARDLIVLAADKRAGQLTALVLFQWGIRKPSSISGAWRRSHRNPGELFLAITVWFSHGRRSQR